MKQLRNLKKKASALLLVVAMTVTTFPQLTIPVLAAELPDSTKFATKEELKQFNTDDTDGVNPAKIYFGNENKQWWIVGSQKEDSLILFADSRVAPKQSFYYDANNKSNLHTDPSLWADCSYPEGTAITEVYTNHYGASQARNTLKNVETSYFTSSEQNLMKVTDIYTDDTKHYDDGYSLEDSVYLTKNKLYLPYGVYDDNYITVGENSPTDLNNGLRVDINYWGKSGRIWLRSPYNDDSDIYGMIARMDAGDVSMENLGAIYALLPAFELDLSSVIFASVAPAISRDGIFTLQDTFTLRYESNNLGSAQISYDKSKVNLTNVPQDTYLVVQNSDYAYAIEVNGRTSVLASYIGLDSFQNCKVWLESTSDRITYAALATEEQEYSINIAGNKGLNITSDNGVQEVAPGTEVQPITIEIEQGYYLPDNYISNIQGLNGLTATPTDTGFTISGTPTADVNITLPEATAMPQAPAPNFTKSDIERTKNKLTVNGTFDTTTYGDIEYQWDNRAWGTNATLSDLEAGSKHTVSVRYQGKGIYLQSDVATVTVSTKKDGNTAIAEPTNLTGIYGQTLKDVTLPDGWIWVNENEELSVGTKNFKARYVTTAIENEYDFTGVAGYNAQEHYVERALSVEVSKADTSIEIKADTMDKAYDGQAVAEPKVEKTGSTNDIVITWYQKEADGSYTELKSAPKVVGSYKVEASVKADDNYNGASTEKEFVISIADNVWVNDLSITGWTYGNEANKPVASAKFGTVEFTFSNEENGTYTSDVPTNASIWYVKASVSGTENYTGLEAKTSFEIAKADSTVTITTKDMDKAYDGNMVAEPKVEKTGSTKDVVITWYQETNGNWTQLTSAPASVGSYKVVVSVAEDDNHNGASAEKEFTISKAKNEWTTKLSIKDWTYKEQADVPEASAKFGDVTFTYSNAKDGTYTADVPTEAGAYYVKASVAGTDNYEGMEAVKEFKILKRDTIIRVYVADTTYTGTPVVVDVLVEGSTGTETVTWYQEKADGSWEELTSAPVNAGSYKVVAHVEADNNYNSASHEWKFAISKADSTVTIKTDNMDKVYDKNAVSNPEVETTGSAGKVTFAWYQKVDTAWEELKTAPANTGNYKVVASVEADENYNGASSNELEFSISQVTNDWKEPLSITGWVYGQYDERINAPKASANFGEVVFTYDKKDRSVPSEAGVWTVTATVAGNENYTGLSQTVEFEITKAVPVYDIPQGLMMKQGDALSAVELPEGFAWIDDTQVLDELGEHTLKAIFTPKDINNYQSVEVDITVEVVPPMTPLNSIPTIQAKDTTLTVGDEFDPLKDVSAFDKEDGDLTKDIKVIENTVDMTKAGTYKVVYQVVDSQKATATKTITVTVKEKAGSQDTGNKPEKGDNAQTGVETGDTANIFLWGMTAVLSAFGIIIIISKKRKMRRN